MRIDRSPKDVKARVISEGLKLLKKDEGIGIRVLADKLGSTQRAIYLHYEGLEDVKKALAAQGFRALASRFTKAARIEGDIVRRIGAMATAYVDFAMSNKGLFRLMFNGEIGWQDKAHGIYEERLKAHWKLEEVLGEAEQQGEVKPAEEGELVRYCWAWMHGIATLALEKQPGFDSGKLTVQKIADRAAEIFVKGARTAPGG